MLVALALVVAVPTGMATTEPDLLVGVDVALKPDAVTLSSTHVKRGHYVEFKLRNTTTSRRMFSLAGRTVTVPPRKFRFLVIMFDFRGKYAYMSRLASGAAVRGTFTVS